MSQNKGIKLWRCDLTLHDYLFFATAKRGSITETGQFIHNYSLTYALNWARSEWRSDEQKAQYADQLGMVKGMYVTPATLLSGDRSLISYRTDTENYALSTIPDSGSIGHGITSCFRPGSVFRFHIVAKPYLDKVPPFVRLGRLMAKAEIKTQHPVEIEIAKGDCTIPSLLNWNDIAAKPRLCDVIVYALPDRLIENARFGNIQYLRARFADGEEARLPLEMGYLRRELCSSWCENAA